EDLAARWLEIDRDATGELRKPLDLRLFGARHHLDVDVAGEPMLSPQQLERGDEVVHHLHRPAGNTSSDEQPVAPAALARGEKDAHELLGLEERAWHLAIAAHGAVVAVEAARVRHEDAQQGRAAASS